jgi:hypothetical protein
MLKYLIEVDSTVEVTHDGILNCLQSHDEYHDISPDISPGSRGANSLTLLGNLLEANLTVRKYEDFRIFHYACMTLRGELGVSVLYLFHAKDSSGVKAIRKRLLPIFVAASWSCVNVVKFLHQANPESVLTVIDDHGTLLYVAFDDEASDIADVTAKVEYLCKQCPALMHIRNNYGDAPLHCAIASNNSSTFHFAKALCDIDATVVRDKCTPSDVHEYGSGYLPLHILIDSHSQEISELSNEGNCFRLLLRLYPAAAGIEADDLESPYDMALMKNLSAYFLRLL